MTTGNRALKCEILRLFETHDLDSILPQLSRWPGRKVVNPLFSFFCHSTILFRWYAVTAMGTVVSQMAKDDFESARVVMRRLLWSLNDESGGIGWGAPEAMGEIMALNPQMASEYSSILISYVRPDQNFIEHPLLQRGVLWGLGRLHHARPGVIDTAADYLDRYLKDVDPCLRGLAAWASPGILSPTQRVLLDKLCRDNTQIQLYQNHKMVSLEVRQLAKMALTAAKKR